MPANHVVLIPLVLGAGFLAGLLVGMRKVRHEWDRAEQRRRDTEEQ